MSEAQFETYVDTLFGGEDRLLSTLRQEAVEQGFPAIQIPVELGRLLRALIAQGTITRILEIGTLFGYSAITMARALPGDGRIVTLEVDERRASTARRNFERTGVADKIEVRVGPAVETLETLEGQSFDLVFIDADKESYPAYLQWALRLTEPGSIIVADNVWRNGSVVQPPEDDPGTRGVATFNMELATSEFLESTIILTRGGTDAASLSVVRSSAG